MADRIKSKAVVGQSGGPTMVINQSLVGVIEQVRKYGEITGLLGAHHGVRGIVNEDFIPLDTVDQKTLEAVAVTPSAGLGSTRDKPDADYCQKIFDVFRKNDVRYFFYIGGNDSADTANIINQLAGRSGYDLVRFCAERRIAIKFYFTACCGKRHPHRQFFLGSRSGQGLPPHLPHCSR